MEISEKGPLHTLSAQNRLAEALQKPPIEPAGLHDRGAEKDMVSLTQSGLDFKTAAQQSHSLPEIREDRVNQIKRQLEAGTYRVKVHRVAVRMIEETQENNQVLAHIDTNS
jgi:negative regulator of flagellin synthesis FlgM